MFVGASAKLPPSIRSIYLTRTMRHAEFHPRHSLLGAVVSDPRMALSDFLKEHGQKKAKRYYNCQ